MLQKLKNSLADIENYVIDTEGINNNYHRMHLNERYAAMLSKEQIAESINKFNLSEYPDKAMNELYKKASRFYNVNNLLIGNGVDDIINLIMRVISKTKKPKMLILEPTYSVYKIFAKINNIELLSIDILDSDFNINTDKIIEISNSYDISLICIPNPLAIVGKLINKEDIIKITENVSSLVLIDEAYMEYADDIGSLDILEKYNNLIVTRTLSKFYGLAGIRIGCGFGKAMEFIKKLQDPYSIDSVSASVAIAVFDNINQDTRSKERDQNTFAMSKFIQELSQCSIVEKIYNTNTNFVLVKLNISSDTFYNYCKQNGFLIRKYSGKMQNFVRISLLDKKTNDEFVKIAKKFIATILLISDNDASPGYIA